MKLWLCFNLVFNPCHTGNTDLDFTIYIYMHVVLACVHQNPKEWSSRGLTWLSTIKCHQRQEIQNQNPCKMYFPGSQLLHVDVNIWITVIFVFFFLWKVKMGLGFRSVTAQTSISLHHIQKQKKPNNFIS